MQVARFWRTKKLRYRLASISTRRGSQRDKTAAPSQNGNSRERLPADKRVKALS